MTLVEIMVALALLGIVLSVCYGSSVALQRGFASTTSWTDARTNQLRVLDSLAVDLRNATAKSFTISADGLEHASTDTDDPRAIPSKAERRFPGYISSDRLQAIPLAPLSGSSQESMRPPEVYNIEIVADSKWR